MFFPIFFLSGPLFALSLFDNTPTPITNGKTLVLAVALFQSKEGTGEAREIQEKISEEFNKDTNIQVIKLSRPVSMGPDLQLETQLADAEQILDQTKADLLIWGNQNDRPFGGKWNIYFSVSNRIKNEVREEGFAMHGPGYLSGVAQIDTPQIVRWIVTGWSGLADKARGMDISGELRGLTVKIYSLLGTAQQKDWDPRTLRGLRKSLSYPLCEYANETHDIPTLQKAVMLMRQIGESYPSSEHLGEWAGDEEMLAVMLEALGEAEDNPKDLLDSVKAIKASMSYFKKTPFLFQLAGMEVNLGNSLERLGERQNDGELIQEAIQAYETGLKIISPGHHGSEWMNLQNGLGVAFENLGERRNDEKDFRESLKHHLAALKEAKSSLAPLDVAMMQVNTAAVYMRLAQQKNDLQPAKKAVELSQEAVTAYRQVHYPYALATALSNLGCQQMTLASIKNNDPLVLNQALASMKESIETLPKDQNPLLWANTRNNMGIISRLLAAKDLDRGKLLDDLQDLDDVQTVNQKATMPQLWASAEEQRATIYGLLTEAYCDPADAKMGEKHLQDLFEVLGADHSTALWIEAEYDLGLLHVYEGWQTQDKAILENGIGRLEEAITLTDAHSLDKCGYQSDLCEAYADRLALDSDPVLLAKAQALMEVFQKDCENPNRIQSRGEHWMNTGALENILGKIKKDPKEILEAKDWVEKGLKMYESGGFRFHAAKAQMILGDIDRNLVEMGRQPTTEAIQQYSSAQTILKSYSPFWDQLLEKKIQETKDVASK